MSTINDIESILSKFDTISLEEVSRASLMRRKDNKYLFCVMQLPGLLDQVRDHYRVLEIEDSRSQHYHTRYFDTDEREMYHNHHRGLANRYKIRMRRYGSGNLHFLEVKKKDGKGVTNKKRVRIDAMEQSALLKEEEFLASCSPYVGSGIKPSMENDFRRITLVNHSQTERVTLDYALVFSNEEGRELDLPGLAVAEIKYEQHLAGSALHTAMRKSQIAPRRFSKYAIGMALLNPGLKQNRFKRRVRKVNQINSRYQQT